MKINLIGLTLLLLCAYPASASAKYQANNNYRVEVIIFSKITKEAIESEQWPIINNVNYLQPNYPGLALTKLNSISYQPIKNTALQLDSIEKSLSNNKYNILYHQAWVQTMSKYKSLSEPISIAGGNLYDENGNIITGNTNLNTTDTRELQGNITISLNKFFNVNINLLLSEPKENINSIANDNNLAIDPNSNFFRFNLLQQSRSRSNEINYIDHPLFGVIYKITKA